MSQPHLSCPNSGGQSSPLMMTCQMAKVTADGHKMRARALLNSASSTSFIMERLAWQLQLPCQHQHVRLAGIGGPENTLCLCSLVTLTAANQKSLKVGRYSRGCTLSEIYDQIAGITSVVWYELETPFKSLSGHFRIWCTCTWKHWHTSRCWRVQSSGTLRLVARSFWFSYGFGYLLRLGLVWDDQAY